MQRNRINHSQIIRSNSHTSMPRPYPKAVELPPAKRSAHRPGARTTKVLVAAALNKGLTPNDTPRAYRQLHSLRDIVHHTLNCRSPFLTVRSATKGKSRSATIRRISSTIYTRLEPSQVVPSAVSVQFVRNLVGAPLNHASGQSSLSSFHHQFVSLTLLRCRSRGRGRGRRRWRAWS